MEQHPIPRQITTFEFKLIGFLTLRQFIYLIVFFPLGYITFKLFPVPLLNIVFGVLVAALGPAFAFVPINDRPLDVWIKNFYKRLTSPTQYLFHKENKPLYFLSNLYFVGDPHRTVAHIESQEKLAAYLAKTSPPKTNGRKKTIHSLFASRMDAKPASQTPPQTLVHYTPLPFKSSPGRAKPAADAPPASSQGKRSPFFTGVIKNHKLIPLPGILIYVKNGQGETVRLLKTNPHGVFATFHPLPPGSYLFEMKDPKNTYFFDRMNIALDSFNRKPLEFNSKELL